MGWLRPALIQTFQLAALTVVYVGMAKLGLTVAFVHSTVSPVWPPTGLAIAALTLWGPGLWPAIAAGALWANADLGLPVAAGIAAGNTLEAVLGALALRRLGLRGELTRSRDAVVVMAVAAIAPLPSATGGVLSLSLAGFSPWPQFPSVWVVWWVGDAMGALVLMPVLLAWGGKPVCIDAPARVGEQAAVLATVATATAFAFLGGNLWARLGLTSMPVTLFIFPPLLWAALRLRPRGATLALATAAVLVVFLAVRGPGPVSQNGLIETLVSLDLMLVGLSGTLLVLIGCVAERARAEAALKDSERRFRATFDRAAVGIAHVGLDGRWLLVNQNLCDILGYTVRELQQITFQDLTHPDDLEADLAQVRALLAGDIETFGMEKRYIRRDGSTVWANLTVALVRDAGGRPNHFISVVEDIDGRKHAETELKAKTARLEELLHCFDLGHIMIRGLDGRIDRWSRGLEQLYGWPSEAAVGRISHELLSARFPQPVTEIEAELLRDGQWQGELQHVRGDGGLLHVASHWAVHRDASGRPASVIEINNDITARKQAEDALRAERDRARQYFDTAAVMMLVVGEDQTVRLINRKGAEILGRSVDEIVGRNWFDHFIRPADRAQIKAVIDQCMGGDSEMVAYFENVVVRRDGTERLIAWHNSVLRDGE